MESQPDLLDLDAFLSHTCPPIHLQVASILRLSKGQETANFASVAFYTDEVMKADGEIYMYSKVDDPEQRATIVGFDKRFVCMPIRNKGIGAIVSSGI